MTKESESTRPPRGMNWGIGIGLAIAVGSLGFALESWVPVLVFAAWSYVKTLNLEDYVRLLELRVTQDSVDLRGDLLDQHGNLLKLNERVSRLEPEGPPGSG